MKPSVLRIVTSVLSVVLFAVHWTDDVVRGISPFNAYSVGGVAILVVWAYGTLVFAERRAGYVTMLLGGIFGTLIPIVHWQGKRINEVAQASGGWSFCFVLIMLAVTSAFGAILAVHGLLTPSRTAR